MKIAVVGAYGNGKTTLTTALALTVKLPRVHATPMRNPAGSTPKPLEDCSAPELVQLTLRRFTERVVAEERSISPCGRPLAGTRERMSSPRQPTRCAPTWSSTSAP